MKKIESIQDYRDFLEQNRMLLHKNAVSIDKLPSDDDWFLEDDWDRIYEQEVIKRGQV